MNDAALVGNPNTGKTSLFNILTGSYEYVGNWPGVTVEKKVGTLKNKKVRLVDLPGIYSLNPLSQDETIATRYLLTEDFSCLLNIVDAAQLERNLYLTVQLLEFGKPVVIGLNMIDVAKKRGFRIDHKRLGELFGVPVVPIVARTGTGCDRLADIISGIGESQFQSGFEINYGPVLENAVARLTERLASQERFPSGRWLALQFFEGNPLVAELLQNLIDRQWLNDLLAETERSVKEQTGAKSLYEHIRQIRGAFIANVVRQAATRVEQGDFTLTERIDRIVANKYLGIPIFLAFMFLTFKLTFDWLGTPLSDLVDGFITGPATDFLAGLLASMGASPFIEDVVLQGIVAGVGGVLVFIPQIFILFFIISLVEDSGYMARVAMVTDRLMEAVGLNGKAFIPMIIGFGCNVPGVMAARTIEQPRERLLTIVLTPLMSCSARLSVYSLFVGTFFKTHQALVVLSLYVLGVFTALILAKVFSTFLLKGESSLFVVELPPYRFPQGRTLMRSTWEKGKGFVRKAGTVIFGGSVAIWFLGYAGPGGFDVPMNESYLAMIGGLLAPLLAPLGFGNWQAGAALLTGFLAKEVVVATMNIIYATPGADTLQGLVANYFTPLQAYSFLVFLLLYVPCLATVAVIRKETLSARWTWFAVGYSLMIAYLLSFIAYRAGKLLGFD